MKPKILFILHRPPPVHGAALLGQFIYDSKTINTNFETKYIELGTTKSFKERKKVNLRKILHFFKLITNCFITNLKFKPAIIYLTLTSNGMGFYKDALIVLALKLSGAKLVYHMHNKGVQRNQHKFLANILYKLVFRNTYVVHGSKWLYPDIKKYVHETKVYYCFNGVPGIKYPLNKKTTEGSVPPVQILYLSNLIESKGVYTLLDACNILNTNNIDFRCTYVGSEGDISSEELQRKIDQYKLTEKVHYAGRKYDREKHDALDSVDIFAFPTHYPNEVFPLVLLEAMQYSLPTVSTPEGGVRDIIDDAKTGFILPQRDANAMAEKLELLINDSSLRQQMGKAGRQKYEQCFTVETYENRISTLIERILKAQNKT